ncbi:MAG: hypothetical protein ACKO01_01225 [Erythrobacter sp.]
MNTLLLDPTVVLTAGALIGLFVVAGALQRAWAGWLDYKRQELDRAHPRTAGEEGSGLGSARIELADLRERIRKLEAIASGVEL